MLDVDESVRLLASCSVSLEEARTDLINDWQPDEVPPTLAMSSLAKALVEHVHELSASELGDVAACIERILEAGTERSKNAAATGFLEAVVAAADAGNQAANVVLASLGPLATEYRKAWDEFAGR
jgi:hypothetical protein